MENTEINQVEWERNEKMDIVHFDTVDTLELFKVEIELGLYKEDLKKQYKTDKQKYRKYVVEFNRNVKEMKKSQTLEELLMWFYLVGSV